MSPEQELEHHRRQERKQYLTGVSLQFAMSVYQENPSATPDAIAMKSFDLADAMYRERTARGCLVGGE